MARELENVPPAPGCTTCGQMVRILAVRIITDLADVAMCAPCMLDAISRATTLETAVQEKDPLAWKTMSFTALYFDTRESIPSESSSASPAAAH